MKIRIINIVPLLPSWSSLCSSLPFLVLLQLQQRQQAGELCGMSQAVPPLPALQWHGTRWRLSWWQGLRFWCFNRYDSRGYPWIYDEQIWWLSGWVRYDPKHAGTNWSPYENCEYLVGLIVLIHELSSSRIQATLCPKFTAGLFLWPFFHLLSAPKLKLSRLLHLNIRTPRLLGCHWCTIGGRGPVAARVAKGLGCAGRGGSLKIHKLVTSWRILCIQWYYLGPAISKLQIRSWCRRRAYPCH